MKRFNLSKYYSINWLLWTSIIGNFIAVCLIVLDTIISGLKDLFLTFVVIEVVSLLLILVIFLTALPIPFEWLLRKLNKISGFNDLIMPIKPRKILYWFAIILISIDIIIHRIVFYFVDYALNGPIPF